MAHSRKRRKKSSARRHNTAGRTHRRMTVRRHRRRSNPGNLGSMMDWVQGGAGVIAGVVGTRAIPQMVLGASNAGPMGYGANAITAVALGWLTNMLFPRNRVLTGTVIAGGFAATLSRIIADKTPFGAQLSLSGMGDWGLGLYQKSNFPYPPRVQNGRLPSPGSSMFTWGDGSQGAASLPTRSNVGADSMSPC